MKTNSRHDKKQSHLFCWTLKFIFWKWNIYICYFWIFVEIYSLECNEQTTLYNSKLLVTDCPWLTVVNIILPPNSTSASTDHLCPLLCVCCFKVLLERGSLTLFEVWEFTIPRFRSYFCWLLITNALIIEIIYYWWNLNIYCIDYGW